MRFRLERRAFSATNRAQSRCNPGARPVADWVCTGFALALHRLWSGRSANTAAIVTCRWTVNSDGRKRCSGSNRGKPEDRDGEVNQQYFRRMAGIRVHSALLR